MADVLKTFKEGDDILASETNDNNQALLSKISDNAAQVQTYIQSELGAIESSISSVQATLQQQINALEENITNLINSRVFTEKALAVSVGTVSLSAYLPQDNQQYLVFVNAYYGAKNGNELYVQSDVMGASRLLYKLDGDSGRSSSGAAFCAVPVGTGRRLSFHGSANWINLCGYMKV